MMVAPEHNNAPHIPVLLDAVVEYMAPADGETYIDATYGAGGYSRALLDAADCKVIGIDRDPDAIAAADKADRLDIVQGAFGDMRALMAERDIDRVDGVVFDIGVSSMQIDQPERGFSFKQDGPLDMRMAQSGQSAADVVNDTEGRDLANIIYRYGEERHSRRIAAAIVRERAEKPIATTGRLASIVRAAIPGKKGKPDIDPATRTFQALRIYVNDELGELERGLNAAEVLLAPGGRLVVVTFHSLEDRIVKQFIRDRAGRVPHGSRHLPVVADGLAPSFEDLTRKPITATADEAAGNPRARSAKLRAARRTDAPAHEPEGAS